MPETDEIDRQFDKDWTRIETEFSEALPRDMAKLAWLMGRGAGIGEGLKSLELCKQEEEAWPMIIQD